MQQKALGSECQAHTRAVAAQTVSASWSPHASNETGLAGAVMRQRCCRPAARQRKAALVQMLVAMAPQARMQTTWAVAWSPGLGQGWMAVTLAMQAASVPARQSVQLGDPCAPPTHVLGLPPELRALEAAAAVALAWRLA